MPRVLPWKIPSAALSTTTSIRADPYGEGKTSPAHSVATSSKNQNRHLEGHRPGSTTSPPEPLQESYMIEGFDDDDGYHMVEDEFLITAQQFTAHLHAAEYQRQKELARTQNAAMISHISRPVVGVTSQLAERKQEQVDLIRKQKAAMRGAGMEVSDDSDDDDSDMDLDNALKGTALYALMVSPRKRAPRLDTIASLSRGTRAAPGFGPSSSEIAESSRQQSRYASSPTRRFTSAVVDMDNTTDDDSDDLDVPSGPPSRMNLPAPTPASNSVNRTGDRPQTHHPASITGVKRSASITQAASSSTAGSQATPPIAAQSSETSDGDSDDNDFFGVKNRMARHNTRDRKRVKTSAQQQGTNNAKRTSKPASSSRKDFIPGFL